MKGVTISPLLVIANLENGDELSRPCGLKVATGKQTAA
tara:strand:- start:1209 stop:1322 length:114 start_codon:yes stop_codon:yes gene_type:complete